MDLEFYVRVRTCEKRVTEKQPLVFQDLEESWLTMQFVRLFMFLVSYFRELWKWR